MLLVSPRTDDGYKVTMAFEQRNFINAQYRERFEGTPLHRRGDPAVEDANERVGGDILLGFHITQGAVD